MSIKTEAYQTRAHQTLAAYLQLYFKKQLKKQPYSDMNLLLQAMVYAVLGGKYLRPSLVYATAETYGAKLEYADAAACAIECIHAYSLVHDDLPAMDNADLRRGKPACHKAFGEATAILVGDALQAIALDCVVNGPHHTEVETIKLLTLLAEAIGPFGMVGGQFLDIQGVTQTANDLETLYRLKTAYLLRMAMQWGAIVANQTDPWLLNHLGLIADDLGVLFQIQDDIFDETLPSSVSGKSQGSDQDNNKLTYTRLMGLKQAEIKIETLNAAIQHRLIDLNLDQTQPLTQWINQMIHRTV